LNARAAAEAKKVQAEYGEMLVDPSLEWDEVITWLHLQKRMKIILKGVRLPKIRHVR
jgi:hypothetical protein